MPRSTITIDRDQRNGLYELVRNHLGSVGDLWDALDSGTSPSAALAWRGRLASWTASRA